jgi:hypothetical protein
MQHSAIVSGLSHGGAGLLLLMAGALIWQNTSLPWQWQGGDAGEFCPDRSAPYSVTSALYQTFVAQAAQGSMDPAVVRQLLGSPACTLPPIAIRAEVQTTREVYYREDGAAIVLGYEEGRLVGYGTEGEPIPETISVVQPWSITEGDRVGGYPVVASLGGLSLGIDGWVTAPESGVISPRANWVVESRSPRPLGTNCILYASAAFPSYLSRLCGVELPRVGTVSLGSPLGQVGGFLHFALLTLRPVSTNPINQSEAQRWHYVAPAPEFVAQFF